MTTENGENGQLPFFAPFFICVGLSAFLISRHTIPTSDIIFGVAYPLYICLANVVCFNSNQLALSRKNVTIDSLGHGQFRGKPAFTAYSVAFQIFAVLLPLLLILLAPADIAVSAVPPLVLLLVQVPMENSTYRFHDVLRILVPIGFTAYRIKTLLLWVENALLIPKENPWYYVGLSLAIINLLMWTYNLFVFLLLRALPVYFDKNYTPPVEMAYTMVPIPKKKED